MHSKFPKTNLLDSSTGSCGTDVHDVLRPCARVVREEVLQAEGHDPRARDRPAVGALLPQRRRT
jgi:hypothetical protein